MTENTPANQPATNGEPVTVGRCTRCGYVGDTDQPDLDCTPHYEGDQIDTSHQFVPGDGSTVILVAIEHRHGINHSVHLTHESAENAVYAHVSDWWDDEINNRYADLDDVPRDLDTLSREDAVRTYFDIVDEERYAIETVPFIRT